MVHKMTYQLQERDLLALERISTNLANEVKKMSEKTGLALAYSCNFYDKLDNDPDYGEKVKMFCDTTKLEDLSNEILNSGEQGLRLTNTDSEDSICVSARPITSGEFRGINVTNFLQSMRKQRTHQGKTLSAIFESEEFRDYTFQLFINASFDRLMPSFNKDSIIQETLTKLFTKEQLTKSIPESSADEEQSQLNSPFIKTFSRTYNQIRFKAFIKSQLNKLKNELKGSLYDEKESYARELYLNQSILLISCFLENHTDLDGFTERLEKASQNYYETVTKPEAFEDSIMRHALQIITVFITVITLPLIITPYLHYRHKENTGNWLFFSSPESTMKHTLNDAILSEVVEHQSMIETY